MRTRMMVAAASMVGLLVVIGALPAASAIAPEPNAATVGDCTGGTRARLTLSRDDGHIEAEIELHTTKVGQSWRVQFSTEGVRFASVVKRTVPEDGRGGLSVSRLATDHAGPDMVTVRARNLGSGERCVVTGRL